MKEKKRKNSQAHLEELLHTLKKLLTSLPASKIVKVCFLCLLSHPSVCPCSKYSFYLQLSDGVSLLPKTVRYPLILNLMCAAKNSFQFQPPSSVKVVGGFLLGTTLDSNRNIDLSLLIPEVGLLLFTCLVFHLIISFMFLISPTSFSLVLSLRTI